MWTSHGVGCGGMWAADALSLERPRNGGRSDGAAAPRSARKTRRERGWACRTIALDPVLVVGDGLASAARQGTGAARLGAPAIFRPATIPRSLSAGGAAVEPRRR